MIIPPEGGEARAALHDTSTAHTEVTGNRWLVTWTRAGEQPRHAMYRTATGAQARAFREYTRTHRLELVELTIAVQPVGPVGPWSPPDDMLARHRAIDEALEHRATQAEQAQL